MERVKPLFERARPARCAFARGTAAQPRWLALLGGQGSEDAREHGRPAPVDEALVERLVRPTSRRRIAPLQAMADNLDDSSQHAAVVHPWDAMREHGIRRQTLHLGSREQKAVAKKQGFGIAAPQSYSE